MTTAPRANAFSSANEHALATILEASQTRSIIASSDIFDISGIKLWARDMPVSSALQRKLLDRQLRNPLESCLMAEDGVTPRTLVEATQVLVESDSPLAVLLRPHAARPMVLDESITTVADVVDAAAAGLAVGAHYSLLGAMLVLALFAAPIAAAAALRIALE